MAHGIRYGCVVTLTTEKVCSQTFKKVLFSDLIWRGTKFDLSRLRRTLCRLLRNSCCRLVASLLRVLPAVLFAHQKLSLLLGSQYVRKLCCSALSYSTGPVVLCSVWSRVYLLLLTNVCEVAKLLFMQRKNSVCTILCVAKNDTNCTILCVARKMQFLVFFVQRQIQFVSNVRSPANTLGYCKRR